MSQEIIKLASSVARTSKFLRSAGFFSARTLHTSVLENASGYEVKLVPKLSAKAKAILPISMGRYDGSQDKIKQYDKEINALLQYTYEELDRGRIGRVDVLSSAGLQKISWGEQKAKEIEEHFFSVHGELLEKQSAFYTWEEFTHKIGKEELEKNYQKIEEASNVGSEWHNLMTKVGNGIRLSNRDLEKSLIYQRLEYAAIYTMQSQYTHIIYMGNLSLAWAYLYKLYDNLPIFTRAIVEKTPKKVNIGTAEANSIIRMIARNLEEVLLNENFPTREKQKLSEMLLSSIYTYTPKNKKEDDKPRENKDLSDQKPHQSDAMNEIILQDSGYTLGK